MDPDLDPEDEAHPRTEVESDIRLLVLARFDDRSAITQLWDRYYTTALLGARSASTRPKRATRAVAASFRTEMIRAEKRHTRISTFLSDWFMAANAGQPPAPEQRMVSWAFYAMDVTSRAIVWHHNVDHWSVVMVAAELGLPSEQAAIRVDQANARFDDYLARAARLIEPEIAATDFELSLPEGTLPADDATADSTSAPDISRSTRRDALLAGLLSISPQTDPKVDAASATTAVEAGTVTEVESATVKPGFATASACAATGHRLPLPSSLIIDPPPPPAIHRRALAGVANAGQGVRIWWAQLARPLKITGVAIVIAGLGAGGAAAVWANRDSTPVTPITSSAFSPTPTRSPSPSRTMPTPTISPTPTTTPTPTVTPTPVEPPVDDPNPDQDQPDTANRQPDNNTNDNSGGDSDGNNGGDNGDDRTEIPTSTTPTPTEVTHPPEPEPTPSEDTTPPPSDGDETTPTDDTPENAPADEFTPASTPGETSDSVDITGDAATSSTTPS
ncbi:MAG: hypothetical protein LBV06_03315 [Propionibacteriaceae bacterium]|nr:hypothetical protein [Propionibacteriaceae bacterium]